MDLCSHNKSFLHLFLLSGKLEWASHDLSTIFIQRKNLVSPSFLRMVLDVIRFGKEAPQVRGERVDP
jgi:predicted NAD/FAD-binding protein